MKRTALFLRIFPLLFLPMGFFSCGNNGNPPENPPTPLPSPEERPTHTQPFEGSSQPRDTVPVLPKD